MSDQSIFMLLNMYTGFLTFLELHISCDLVEVHWEGPNLKGNSKGERYRKIQGFKVDLPWLGCQTSDDHQKLVSQDFLHLFVIIS